MIEIILLLTAALSAREAINDSIAEPPKTQLEWAAPTAPAVVENVTKTAPDSPMTTAESAIQPPAPQGVPASTSNSNLLPRLAAESLVPARDLDLDAAAMLISSAPRPEGAPAEPTSSFHLVRKDEQYVSGGRRIKLEVLRPDHDEPRPAILILHGASGIGDGAFYRGAAEMFAERGYVTFLPHYLAEAAPAPAAKAKGKKETKSNKADPKPQGDVRAGFNAQQQILKDALNTIARNPYVDASRIGVFGMSLGGFHALNLSAIDDRVTAVVNMAGALRGNTMPVSNRMAPTLALHGNKDAVVPVGRAKSLSRYLNEHSIPHELVVYPDQGHFFRGKAQHDALQRSADFFARYFSAADRNRFAGTRPVE